MPVGVFLQKIGLLTRLFDGVGKEDDCDQFHSTPFLARGTMHADIGRGTKGHFNIHWMIVVKGYSLG